MINCQLSKQGIHWLVSSPDRIAGSGVHRGLVGFWSDKVLVFKWVQAQVRCFKCTVVFLWAFMSHTIKILISNWPRTRKFSQLLQARKAAAFDFSRHGHALVTLYVQFLCSDWSKFDRRVHAEIYAASGNLFTDSWSWQGFVSSSCERKIHK